MTTPSHDGALRYTILEKQSLPQLVFCEWMTIGAVVCATSHLSILRDAYSRGYETIWIIEDDILIVKDPHQLSNLIINLDVVTDGEWDRADA